MEYRPVEIKVISASGIKDVNTLSKMDVYVVVSVSGDPRSVQRSPIDKDGGVNPRWHHYDMKFLVDEVAAQNSRIGFVFQIMSNRTLGDKESGRVYIPVKELLDRYFSTGASDESTGDSADDSTGAARPHLEVEYQVRSVRTQSGKLKGTFKFSYAFGEKFLRKAPQIEEPPPPQMAYPAGPGLAPNGYPTSSLYPAPTGYGVPPAAYPYPVQPAGYGGARYQGVVAAAPWPAAGGGGSGSQYGMGAAAGIGMGLLGGLLIGEMVDDVADMAFD